MIGFLPTPVPAVQTVGGVARNENIYDAELVPMTPANILGTQIQTFNNFGQFQTVAPPPPAAPITKQPNRDTNLSGTAGGGGLPQGTQMFAYAWACEIHTGNADLGLAANVGVFEQINRYRRLTAAILQINQTNQFITQRLVDLLSFEDAMYVNTTHGAATVMAPAIGSRAGKSMTSTQRYATKRRIKNRKTGQVYEKPGVVLVRNSPYILQPIQNFRILHPTATTATGDTFALTVPLWVVDKFLGVLVRGIS